ncbi:DinB family protein [Camelliibacillus cellulosilyticus]|uniref:DinB family protein n=1 Tax=Camelliibacillus cellulosilyticus TaxID=2174486 RepID=A0ABV9GND6_9BACL
MDAVSTFKNELLKELEVGIRSMTGLLEKVKPKDWDYRPAANMRTLQELAWHIIAIPEVDLNIWLEKDQATIKELESKYEHITSTEEMIRAMNDGYQQYKAAMLALSDEDFLTKKTTPFYLEKGEPMVHWLVEEVSHLFHHRAQFFNYLKQLGYDVSMSDLYV